MRKSAEFSPCRRYRYALWRDWGALPGTVDRGYVLFVGLNPSTADETNDDPTIRRCIAFAKAWGYSGLCMVNLFAFRATNPADMLLAPDPVGPDNDACLRRFARNAGVVIAGWGVHGTHLARDAAVKRLLPNLHYLRLTKDGHPGHPLYLPKTLVPQPFAVAA
ncbi:hypothetical protein WJ96_05795 [Burkholderia ubonensis]|uniref:DUF1643 domain-containing protein n=1 Tax=Burkholderia ubonensis TaxID=101571 RepID=A0AAW3MZ35_9BURK|nr:DUF1643 domain-containing protein [Burkholderia ubonensis]KVP75269.1 hypothetical protein WJ93_07590 [Burkholderia ubonensis]KVP98082.1 hypothetical protein WJ96_05795 [Burkholderia ubonensis]KVZ92779.1 hypothetical protein WL25_17455 [Burkholderia ubonensis]